MSTICETIKRLRLENHWSQEELAERVGYSDRSTIAKIEAGDNNISQKKIMAFAKVFGVSPGYLLGDDGTDFHLNKEEKEIIIAYRSAPEHRKASVRDILRLPENQGEWEEAKKA